MIFELAQDLHDTLAAMPREHPKHRMLELLEEAIRRDIHFIDRHPTTLFQCMWNTCWWYDCPEAHTRKAKPPSVAHSLQSALDSWHGDKCLETPCFTWLKSQIPPEPQLGTGPRAYLRGHMAAITSIAWSAGGDLVATGSCDRTTRIWNPSESREIACLRGHKEPVSCLSWGPDDQRLMTGALDGTVRLWDTHTGAQIRCVNSRLGKVESVSWCHHRREAAVGGDSFGVRLWMPDGGKQRSMQSEAEGFVSHIVHSPDGTMLAACTFKGESSVAIWDIEASNVIADFQGMPGGTWRISWDPTGTKLVGCGSEPMPKYACIWDWSRGKEIARLVGHSLGVRCVAWSPDGTQIATGSYDSSVRIWDARNGRELACYQDHEGPVEAIAWSPDGKRIASASRDGQGFVYHVTAPAVKRPRSSSKKPLNFLRYALKGHTILAGIHDGSLCVLDSSDGRRLKQLRRRTDDLHGADDHRCSVVPTVGLFSPDSRFAAVGIGGKARMEGVAPFRVPPVPVCVEISVWHVSSGVKVARFRHLRGLVHALAFSRSGLLLGAGSEEGEIRAWQCRFGFGSCIRSNILPFLSTQQCKICERLDAAITSIAFSPDDMTVLVGCGDGIDSGSRYQHAIVALSARSGMPVRVLREHRSPVIGVAYSLDGNRIASSSSDGAMRLWDAADFRSSQAPHASRDAMRILSRRPEFFAVARSGVEMIIEGEQESGYYPTPLRIVDANPITNQWAGSRGSKLHLFSLQIERPVDVLGMDRDTSSKTILEAQL